MASITKVITALVVLDAKPLGSSGKGATITWTPADAKLYDKYYLLNATIAAMKSGSTMSEYDALQTMLVASACNYAEAVSDWAFGSQAAFVYAARRWLTAHGMHSTTVTESTGITLANTSTPGDLITLGKIAMANTAVAGMVDQTTPDATPATEPSNTNDLLGTAGIDGIKTGTLSGSDLLFHSVITPGTPNPLSITGVVLDGESRASVDADVKSMIASVAAGFHYVSLGAKGEVVGKFSTPWGAESNLVLGGSASTLTWSDAKVTSSITATSIKTGKAGEKVGTVTFTAGTKTFTFPVELASRIRPPSAWWRLSHPSQLLGTHNRKS
jgi:D-alanyl-D-alanine carboxypeptidase (penicillin-binding protein 5/6)